MTPSTRRTHRVATLGVGAILFAGLAVMPDGGTPQAARVTSERPLAGPTTGRLLTAGWSSAPAPAPAAVPKPPPAAPPAGPGVAKESCVGEVKKKAKPWYPGPSTSVVYDSTFKRGPALPDLDEYTPQGMAAWEDWDGKGNSLLVVAAYRLGHHSRLYGIEPKTGKIVGTVLIPESHLGGIAISGDWLFTQEQHRIMRPEGINRFPLSDLRAKMVAPGKPLMSPFGAPQLVYSADFMTSHGGEVWAGQYNMTGNDRMYRYAVEPSGLLTVIGEPWEVPARTQGVLVTPEEFLFVTSDPGTRGRMWIVRRGHTDLDHAPGRCFRNPDLGQGMAILDGVAYVAYESGAKRFDKKSTANKIRNLHRAPLDTLTSVAKRLPGVSDMVGP